MVEFDGSGATKDIDQHSHATVGLIDHVHVTLEILEVALLNADAISLLKGNRRLYNAGTLLDRPTEFEDAVHVLLKHWRRLAPSASEVANAGRLADDKPGLIIDRHIDQDV